MKRDMDLIRDILLIVESAVGMIELSNAGIKSHSDNEIGYHLEMLIDHGYIDGDVKTSWGGDYIQMTAKALTLDGHDFLDAMRDNKVWSKAKKVISDTVGSTTLSVIKETCNMVALAAIKGAIS